MLKIYADFCRFKRRFHLGDLLPRFAYVAAKTTPMPARLLKLAEGLWVIRYIFKIVD